MSIVNSKIKNMKKNKYSSFKWMLIATLFFSLMGLCVKLSSDLFTSHELVFYRSFLSLIIIYPVMLKEEISIKTNYIKLHLMRSIIGFISLIMFFYAITRLQLGTSMTLNYTSPLFLALFLPMLTKQKFNYQKVGFIVLGFIGVVLILKPIVNNNFPGLIGLLSGTGAAIAYIYVSKLGQLREPDLRTVFYFTLISSLLGIFFIDFDQMHKLFKFQNLALLIGLAIFATIAQLAITKAYRVGKALINGTYSYLTIVFSSVWGFLFLGELMDLLTIFGIALVIFAGLKVRA